MYHDIAVTTISETAISAHAFTMVKVWGNWQWSATFEWPSVKDYCILCACVNRYHCRCLSTKKGIIQQIVVLKTRHLQYLLCPLCWWFWCQIRWKRTCRAPAEHTELPLSNIARLGGHEIPWPHYCLGLCLPAGAYPHAGPGYCTKAMQRFHHTAPSKWQNQPYPHTAPTYGASQQYVAAGDTSPPLSKTEFFCSRSDWSVSLLCPCSRLHHAHRPWITFRPTGQPNPDHNETSYTIPGLRCFPPRRNCHI